MAMRTRNRNGVTALNKVSGKIGKTPNVPNTNPKIFTVTHVFTVFVVLFSLFVFWQNHISADFDTLVIRSTDDFAFSYTLRQYHENSNDIRSWLVMNEYGYGWIYWFIIKMLTFPAYWLFVRTGIELPLVILPRHISLAFAIGCMYLAYKLASLYTKEEYLKATAAFMFPLFSTCSYFAGRFGTVPQTAFFCMLACYWTAKENAMDRKKLFYVLLSLAAACATKLTAIIIVPTLGLLIFSRFNWSFSMKNLVLWLKAFIPAAVIGIFLLSPAFIFAPIAPQYAKDSFHLIKVYVSLAQGGDVSFFDNIYNFLHAYSFMPIVILLLTGVFIKAFMAFRGEKRNFDFFCYASGFTSSILIFCALIKHGSLYVILYSFSIGCLWSLGVLALNYLPHRYLIKWACIMLVVGQVAFMGGNVWLKKDNNILKYYQNRVSAETEIEEYKQIRETMFERSKTFSLVQDVRFRYLISPLKYKNVQSKMIENDFGSLSYENVDIAYILLDKQAVGFLPENNFLSAIATLDGEQQEQYQRDRASRKQLVQNGSYNDHQYELLLETDNGFLYGLRLDDD
ncbi:hypothetical protein LQZ18_07010 [Lachnospiraceae bacterium ZAX-1]